MLERFKSLEMRRLAAFGIIISFLTSVYVSFISLVINEGFKRPDFWKTLLPTILKTWLIILPFIMITGPLVRRLVEKLIRK